LLYSNENQTPSSKQKKKEKETSRERRRYQPGRVGLRLYVVFSVKEIEVGMIFICTRI
jgi:hypothetical protein